MTITDEVTFSLERFEPTLAGELRVTGSWNGIERGVLGAPTLILHRGEGSERLDAVEGNLNSVRNWSAAFRSSGDAASVKRAELELGGSIVIDLPAPSSRHRRFGRARIPVRAIEAVGPAVDGDLISLHTALVRAREEAAAANEALESAQGSVIRAREETRRERSRRQADAARLGEALDTLRQLAESAVEKERATTKQVIGEVNELEAALAAERSSAAALRLEHESAISSRDAATAKLRESGAAVERLRAALDEAQQLSAEAGEQARAELERLRAALSEHQRVADATAAENERLRGRVDDAERDASVGREEAEALRAELAEARLSQEEAERLRNDVAAERRAAEVARTEAERLKQRLLAIRAAVEEPPDA